MVILKGIVGLVFIIVIIYLVLKLSMWAFEDASNRDRSGLAVFIAVIFFFPWGLFAWLLFRPDLTPKARRKVSTTKGSSTHSDTAGTPWANDPGHT